MTKEQLFEAFRIMKSKGVEEFGIHAFLASNTVTNEYYPTLAKVLFEVAVQLQKETGAKITFINLSGGIGIPYRPDQEKNDIYAISAGVRRVYEEVLVPGGMGDALCTELGRYMMCPYGCLVTRAIHEKHIHKDYIGVDACANLDASRNVRRVPSYHGAGQGAGRVRSPVRHYRFSARTMTSSPLTGCSPKIDRGTIW